MTTVQNIDYSSFWYPKKDHIPVLGHRGICAKYPENTMSSFAAAIDLGVDLIEFDINVTADNELVIVHDNDITRTSDHAGLTRNYTLAELKTFNFAAKFEQWKAKEEILTLRELLKYVVSRSETLLLNVEIKDYANETVDKTIATLKEFDICERCVIACFDAGVLRYTKKNYPFMRLQGFPGRYMSNFTEDTYDVMFGMGIPISWKDVLGDESIAKDVAFARSKNILPWLFVADSEKEVARCVKLGAANITGNDPKIALNTLRKMGLHK